MAYNDKKAAEKYFARVEQRNNAEFTGGLYRDGVTVIGPGEHKLALQNKRLERLRKANDKKHIEALINSDLPIGIF